MYYNMKGSINTKSALLKKFTQNKPYSVLSADTSVIDFSVTDEKNDDTKDSHISKLLGDDDLDIRKKSINEGVAVIVEYEINEDNFKPFIRIKFNKKKGEIVFNKIHTKKHEIPKMSNSDYEGLYEYEDTQYLFYSINTVLPISKVTSKSDDFYLLVDDIINTRTYYDIKVHSDVSDFFVKNNQFIFLIDETGSLIETPISGFRGEYYKKVGMMAGLGMSRSGPYASLGPFFYFGNFDRSIRYAVMTINKKPLEINGEKITIGDTPIFTKGCIVKYALFLGNSKLMLNLENDPEDDSEISKHFSKENKFIKDTLKLRDTNGKWTKQFDSVIQSELEIFDRKLGIDRKLDPAFILRTFEQQSSLDYMYVNTDNVKKDSSGQYDLSQARLI